MANPWTEAEYTALFDTIGEDVPMNTVLQAVQAVAEADSIPKTLGAIRTRARNRKLGLDYSGSDKDGKFHKGVRRRHHEQEESISIEMHTIVGESRIVPPIKAPTTSARTNQNLTDAIVPQNSDRDALISIYDDVQALLQSQNYSSLKSITVATDKVSMTILKDAS